MLDNLEEFREDELYQASHICMYEDINGILRVDKNTLVNKMKKIVDCLRKKEYSLYISNAFNEEDRLSLNIVFTVKYRSKLNNSVIDEAMLCKNKDGELNLQQVFKELKEIITSSYKSNLLISTELNSKIKLTNDEMREIKQIEDFMKL